MNRLRAGWERLQGTKAWRAWSRVGDARGGILAGGIAYFAFFSVVPALTVGFTIFGYVLGANTGLQQEVAQKVNGALGFELIGLRPGQGVVQLADLVQQEVLTLAGVFGLAALLYAGLGWLEGTREGIRAVFGLGPMANPWLAKVRDVAALLLLGLVMLASVVAGFVVAAAAGAVSGWLGWSGTVQHELVVTAASTLLLAAVDASVFLLFLTVLADVGVPVADLPGGAVLGGIGMQALKYAGGLLVHRISRNPVLASSVVLVGLLVWMNLAARLTLLVAGWSATTAADRGHLDAAPRPAGGSATSRDPRRGTMGGQARRPDGRPGAGEAAMAEPGRARAAG
ncbi:MAG TPA: YihY/virulence factor BrkB family protein, partial [Kineosporiaceae bacterium]|nr:YihY/virulence factor BrkB family protein [Kineosporiaceae bacterium]